MGAVLVGLRNRIIDAMTDGRTGLDREAAQGILSGLTTALVGVITIASVGALIAWQAFGSLMTATVVFAGLVIGSAISFVGVGWIVLSIGDVLILDAARTFYLGVVTRGQAPRSK